MSAPSPREHQFGRELSIDMVGYHEETISRHFFASVPHQLALAAMKLARGGVWLKNGGRIYLEHGGAIEYATPPSASVEQLYEHQQAGILALAMTARNISRHVQSSTPSATASPAYLRTGFAEVDLPGLTIPHAYSIAHHENYQAPAGWDNDDLLAKRRFESFLATRHVIAGVGMVDAVDAGSPASGYRISQRADASQFEGTNYGNHGAKPAWAYKQRTTGDRIEVRLGETSSSQWVTEHTFAYTQAVIDMITAGVFPDEDALIDTHPAMTHVLTTTNSDPFQPQPELGGDNAIMHQLAILWAANDFVERRNQSGDEILLQRLRSIRSTLYDLEDVGEMSPRLAVAVPRLAWAARLGYILDKTGLATMQDISTASEASVRADLSYDGISRQVGLIGDNLPAAKAALYSNNSTLPHVRYLRDRYLEEASDVITVNWDSVQYMSSGRTSFSDAA